jgi:hypothetical protein
MYDNVAGRAWAANEIAERLQEAFERLFGAAIASKHPDSFMDATTGREIRAADLIRIMRDSWRH